MYNVGPYLQIMCFNIIDTILRLETAYLVPVLVLLCSCVVILEHLWD